MNEKTIFEEVILNNGVNTFLSKLFSQLEVTFVEIILIFQKVEIIQLKTSRLISIRN